MTKSIAPTNEEMLMKADDFIVSKTDGKGKITYCNEIFIEFSGYKESELINQPHNIIRHPDMPRSVYRMMWETIQKQQEFFGLVKNLSQTGAFYWTFANVTPSFNQQGQCVGFYSVRRQPNRKAVEIIAPIYKSMIEEESKHSSSKAAMDASQLILDNAVAEYGITYNEFIYSHAK